MIPGLLPPTESGPRAMIIVASLFLTLATVSVLLRFYVRLRMLKSWGLDDWAMMITLLFYAAECSMLITIAKIEQSGLTLNNAEMITLVTSSHSRSISKTDSNQAGSSRAITLHRLNRHPQSLPLNLLPPLSSRSLGALHHLHQHRHLRGLCRGHHQPHHVQLRRSLQA